jgi:hypothetical protein
MASVGSSVQQMRESFEAQFEASGNGKYIYRRGQKGEAIPVTAEERDRFIQRYVRRIWLILGGMMAVLAAFWGAVFWWMVGRGNDLPNSAMYVGTGVIAVVSIALMYWIRGAPARELEGRTPVSAERSSEEMRGFYLNKTTYGQLAAVAGFGAFLIGMPFLRESDPYSLRWLDLIGGAGLILFAGIRALQKWRYDSEHPSDVM